MFNLDGLSNIRKVRWNNLNPGSIILSGVTVNGSSLPELRNFPVITKHLLHDLRVKYQFLQEREFLVADALYNYTPGILSDTLNEAERGRTVINQLRDEYQNQKKMILHKCGIDESFDIPIIGTDNVEKDFLIRDSYNSFSYMYGLDENLNSTPSFFHRMDLSLSISDLITNRLQEKFNLPEDNEINLHLVADLSKSMDSGGKIDILLAAVNSFYRYITSALKNTNINLYVFADECRPADSPLTGREIDRGNTSYSAFMKKVLHYRDRDVKNMIILFTDGEPTDRSETMKMAKLIKKNKIDYTQIIFNIKEEQRHEVKFTNSGASIVIDKVVEELTDDMTQVELSDDELDEKLKRLFSGFTEIAETCGGNQIILKINELLSIVTVECYDKYLGLLTLMSRNQI